MSKATSNFLIFLIRDVNSKLQALIQTVSHTFIQNIKYSSI